MSKTNRNPVISLSRSLGMLFIVICHIIKYYHFIPGHSILGQFFSCGVPLFIFISGYLYSNRKIICFHKWYLKRFISISIPAIIVSLTVISILLIMEYKIDITTVMVYLLDLEGLVFISWKWFSKIMVEVPSLGPLWFTTVIMLCYLLIPILSWFFDNLLSRNYKLFSFTFLAVGAIVSFLVHPYFSLSYFFFFAIGYLCGRLEFLDKVNTFIFVKYSILALMSMIVRVILNKYIDETNLYTSIAPLLQFFVGTWFVVFFAYVYTKNPHIINRIAESNVVNLCDGYSYYVYLVHGCFCMGRFNMYQLLPLVWATIVFSVCTAISAIVVKFISEIIQKNLLKRI